MYKKKEIIELLHKIKLFCGVIDEQVTNVVKAEKNAKLALVFSGPILIISLQFCIQDR